MLMMIIYIYRIEYIMYNVVNTYETNVYVYDMIS